MKRALVCGAGGFIGGHLVERLKAEGYWVSGIDLKHHEYMKSAADEFELGDLRDPSVCRSLMGRDFDEVYQLAADMGGAGYIFSGSHDADIMHNSAMINLNVLPLAVSTEVEKIFYSSSACIYPEHNQMDPGNPLCSEDSAYPADPDSEYGWEKLFSERLYLAYQRNYGLDVRIARFHNIFGPFGAWNNGREKSPAALCRKVAENDAEIEIWGDGLQTRSFLYIDECIDGIRHLMNSDFSGPVNIGSAEMISIDDFARMIMDVAGRKLRIRHVAGPVGVRGRCSHNELIDRELGWKPSQPLRAGIERTYEWIHQMVHS